MSFTIGNQCNAYKKEIRTVIDRLGADKKDRKKILGIIDQMAYMIDQADTSARVLERILTERGANMEEIFRDYMRILPEEASKYRDYVPERYEEDEE